jgi:dimethylargininase
VPLGPSLTHAAITHLPPPTLEAGERTFVARAPIDNALALRQHARYCATLAECGARVVTLDVNATFPDAVFVEDTAVVFDQVAVLASPGAPSRRGEPAGIAPELARYRELRSIEYPDTLDGGDVVVAGRTVLVGASQRTNAGGARSLAALIAPFGYTVRRVALRDCLHLKSACCALPDGRLLVNPAWLDSPPLDDFTLVPIPPDEPFAADVATIGDIVILSATNPRTLDLVAALGFPVRAVEVSEFEKAEGGVTCLSILIPLQ